MNAFGPVAKGGGLFVKLLAGIGLSLTFLLQSFASDSLDNEVGIVNGSSLSVNSYPALTALLSGRGAVIKLNDQIEIDGFFFGHGLNTDFSGQIANCGDASNICSDADEKICLINVALQQQGLSPAVQLANCATGGGIGALFISAKGVHLRTDLFDGVPAIPAVFIHEVFLERVLGEVLNNPLAQSSIQALSSIGTMSPLSVEVTKRVAESILCGAVYLDDRWLLTAAHCVGETTQDGFRQILPWEITATVGAFDLTADTHLTQAVDEIHRFKSSAAINGNDIALLKLARTPILDREFTPVDTNVMSDPGDSIKIAESGSVNASVLQSAQGLVLGWGSTEVREPDETISSLDTTSRVPLAAMVTLIPASQCGALWHDYLLGNGISADAFQVDNRHLCAHDPEHQRDTCQGDSGGPLLINIDGQWQLAGLTSFGLGCGSVTGVPAVYTKVSEYTDWIERTTGIEVGDHVNGISGLLTTPDESNNSLPATNGGGSQGTFLLLPLFLLLVLVGAAGCCRKPVAISPEIQRDGCFPEKDDVLQ